MGKSSQNALKNLLWFVHIWTYSTVREQIIHCLYIFADKNNVYGSLYINTAVTIYYLHIIYAIMSPLDQKLTWEVSFMGWFRHLIVGSRSHRVALLAVEDPSVVVSSTVSLCWLFLEWSSPEKQGWLIADEQPTKRWKGSWKWKATTITDDHPWKSFSIKRFTRTWKTFRLSDYVDETQQG